MKSIKLLRLTLNQFQGGSFVFEPGGEDADCFAANGLGKTRLASAFSWVLFGKDSLGRNDFSIKNLDATREAEHGLDHSVECELSVDGRPVTLKKVYSEKWIKERGRAEAVFSGHRTQHSIDGVPVQEKEYLAQVAQIAGDELIFRLVTSPTVFPNLPSDKGVPGWQRQRNILFDVCGGDIPDGDVISADAKLARLTEIIGKTKMDDYKKIAKTKQAEINKALTALPIRIDECRRSIPDVTGLDHKAIIKNVGVLETELNDAKLRLQGVDTGGNLAALSKKLAGINADINARENRRYIQGMAEVNKLTQQIAEITGNAQQAERQAQSIKGEIEAKQARMATIAERLEARRAEWVRVDAEAFQDGTPDTCAACGQSLPADRVEEAREKSLAAFNLRKAEKLTQIEQDGKALSVDIERIKAEVVKLHQDALSLPKVEATNVEALTAERDALKAMAENYESIPGYITIVADREALEASIAAEKAGKTEERDDIQGRVAEFEGRLAAAKAEADKFTRREKGEQRIEELKVEEKKLAAEYEELEQTIYLCEQFVRTKARILTDKINARFEMVNFKLFNVQINGGLEECCIPTIKGVPYDSGLNSAGRTQAGCDIVRTLQRHYDIHPVIWIDNRESCTEIPAMECQVISLYVSPEDIAMTKKVRHLCIKRRSHDIF